MALYPSGTGDKAITAKLLEDLVQRIFDACGMRTADAATLAGSLVLADLRGIHSHGVIRVPDYVAKLRDEGVNPRGTPEIIEQDHATAIVDGDNSMGQIGGTFAMNDAISRASTFGVAAVALRHSNHCGAMDFYTRLAADNEMIGVATTNALPTMAPWGGREKIVGINPLSIALPTDEPHPLIIDMAFGATAHGKIRVYAQKGQPLPEGWALDSEGRPTTDAQIALDGLIQPLGAFKGVGLAIMSGALSSLLSGAAYGTELGNMVDGPTAGRDGQFFAAIKIASFEDITVFKRRAGDIVRQIHASAKAPGIERIYAPGALEHAVEKSYRQDGITLSADTLNDVIGAAQALEVDASAVAPA